jgi:single-strand DNA-binding protein
MFTKLIRLGRDVEVRYTQNGDAVAGLAMAYDIGFGDKKRSQWLDGSLWGKRAESLAPYLKKGTQVVIYADDLEVAEFQKKDGTNGVKLKCRIVDLNLVSGQQQQQSNGYQPPAQYQQTQQFQQPPVDKLGNLEDIPF